ncbi:MAG TPA: GAF domain-containing protein, partial [Nitrospirota bacterium]|nr:GAF domain-containing protein [Nitrospirota bacterium]
MDDRDKTIADMNAELERLRRRIAELGSGAAPGIYDEGYRLLFENNPLPLWVYDRETLAFLAVNDAAVRKYGYSREEFLAMTIADIRPREDVPLLLENIAKITEGLDEAGVWRHRRKDGSIINVEIVSHTLIFEGRKAELVLANDITERRQAEAKLRTIARLYAFLSQINQAIVRTRDRNELFRTICRVAIEFGRFRMAWVGLIEEATGIVRPAAHAGWEEGYLNSLSIGINDEATSRGPTGSALRKGVLTICDDIATDPRMLPWRDEALKRGYRSSAAIPFRLKEKVIGSLNLYAAEPGFFTEDERKLLTEIGVDISFALGTMEGEKERKRAQ